jgi:hypothetical protein
MSPEKYRHTPAERRAILRELRWVWESKDEQELMQILRRNGVQDENPRFAAVVKLFREMRSGKP